MSNSLAIAAVTETLRQILDRGINASVSDDPSTDPDLAGTSVTTRPPDKARSSQGGNQVNLFLYQTSVNPAWRNQDLPRQVRNGESGRPPLPLDLRYLMTAFGADDEGAGILAHRLLGRAMSLLHDYALLDRADIQLALAGNDLYDQIELVHVIPHPMPTDEISRLWTAFQTAYRISASYQVSVVLIESNKPISSPLPVLTRGTADSGPVVLAAPPPVLDSLQGLWTLAIQPPPVSGPLSRQVSATGGQAITRLGDSLRVRAQNIAAAPLALRFSNPLLAEPVELIPQPGDRPGELKVDLPAPGVLDGSGVPAMAGWAPGFYTAALVVRATGQPVVTTNALPVMLAPAISVSPQNAAAGDIVFTVTCTPRLRFEQHKRVFLLFGSRQAAPESISTPGDQTKPTTLTFKVNVPSNQKGVYTLRLRVDGVDSLPFAAPQTATSPAALIFDPQQQVTIT